MRGLFRLSAQRAWGSWMALMTAMVAVLVLCTPGIMLAEEPKLEPKEEPKEEPKQELRDRLMIRAGWAYVFGVDADVTVRGDRTGIGASVDFAKTLGGDDSTSALRVDSLYRFNERHAVGFSWYRVALGGENTILDRQIEIGGNTINANASVHSDLNVNLYRFLYNWSFYRSDKVELALSPGFYVAATKFDFTAQGNILLPNNQPSTSTGVSEHVTLPLPSFGVLLNYNVTPRLQVQTRTDFFYLRIADYEGVMFEFYAGLEYRLFKNFAVGAAYDRLATGLQNTSRGGFELDVAYNLAYFYGTVYLF